MEHACDLRKAPAAVHHSTLVPRHLCPRLAHKLRIELCGSSEAPGVPHMACAVTSTAWSLRALICLHLPRSVCVCACVVVRNALGASNKILDSLR